jgi:hypothetical protein
VARAATRQEEGRRGPARPGGYGGVWAADNSRKRLRRATVHEQEGREEEGAWASLEKTETWARPKGLLSALIYSKTFQMTLN